MRNVNNAWIGSVRNEKAQNERVVELFTRVLNLQFLFELKNQLQFGNEFCGGTTQTLTVHV